MSDLSYLTIDHAPNKTTYQVGDRFERYGMVVKAHYSDGSSNTIDFYGCSPIDPLTINDNQITISFMNKSVTQSITVNNPPSTGYFINKCLDKAVYGNNPYVNTVDGSISFYNFPIIVERDSYTLSVVLSYHSRMTDKESDLIKGFYKGFRTNYHQFLIKDGKDNDNNDIYKYIDGNGFIHTFLYNEETGLFHDKEGRYLVLRISNRTITDSKDNVYTFDTNGRLISIQSGLNSSDVKLIEYNSDGIRKIYDNRNPEVYIKFSYNYSFLVYIKAYYHNDDNPLKTYTFNGVFGQITSITESVGTNTRTLYEYLYNDREKVRRIVDHLNQIAYRLTYDFDTAINDYRFNSIRQGYISNDSLIEQSGIYFARRTINVTDLYKPILELVINSDNRFKLSFMSDANGEPVSSFELSGDNHYKTLFKEKGIRVYYSGVGSDDINGKESLPFIDSFQTNSGLTLGDFPTSPFVVLSGFIRLKNSQSRVKLSVVSSHLSDNFIDLNPSAYNVWQYFEIILERDMNENIPVYIGSFQILLEGVDNQNVEADVAYLRLNKCEERKRLFFLNNNEPVAFDTIKTIKLAQQNGAYRLIDLTTNIGYLTEVDLINTLKRFYSCSDNPSILYLTNGKIIKAFYQDFYAPVSPTNALYFLEDDVSNDYLGQSNNWFFATSLDAKTKTYYRFKQTYYEVIVRNEITDNNNQVRYIDDISKYNYQDQLLENRKTHYDENLIASITTTTYEYFIDGQVKKIYQTNGNEIIVLYEASLDSNNRIIRKTSGLQSVDIIYNNYLEGTIVKNSVNGATITNTSFKKEISYDDYLQDISSIAFKSNSINSGTNSVSRNNLTSILSINNASLYQMSYNNTNNTLTFKRYNGSSYDNVVSIRKERLSDITTYYDYTNVAVSDIYDDYGAMLYQRLDEDDIITYCYDSHVESGCVIGLDIIMDDCVVDGHTVYTYFNYNQLSKSLESINFYNHKFDIFYDETSKEATYRFGNSAYDQIKYIYENNREVINYDSNPTLFTSRIITFDKFGRLDSNIKTGATNNLSKYFYAPNSNLLNKFEFIYVNTVVFKEIYSYDAFGNISGKTYSNKVQPWSNDYTRAYSYDGFGRIVSETTPSINVARNYAYDNQGRMTAFGNSILVYNSRNQLQSFGNTNFTYDNYGNRTSKDGVEYEYERGHLLKSIKLNNNETISFTYDYAGKRYQKFVNGSAVSTFYYDGNTLIGEDRSDGTKLRFIYDNTGIVGFRYFHNNQFEEYDYIKNPFGVIVGIFDGEHIVAQYDYDAWGNPYILWQSTPLIGTVNPIRYKGYYYDDDTALYYLLSRYYDPEIGQFISPDDYSYLTIDNISGLNLYTYCRNNPVMFSDSTGHFAISAGLFLGILGATFAIGFTASVISQGFNYGWQNINPFTFIQAGIDGLFAAASMAFAYTGFGLTISMAVGGVAGLAQYTIDSTFHNDFSWSGALIVTGLGILGGFFAGRGMQHHLSIGENLDDVGRSALKALLTAFDRHGYGAAYDATINLWGSRLTASLVKSYTKTFVATFKKLAIYNPLNYLAANFISFISKQFEWEW